MRPPSAPNISNPSNTAAPQQQNPRQEYPPPRRRQQDPTMIIPQAEDLPFYDDYVADDPEQQQLMAGGPSPDYGPRELNSPAGPKQHATGGANRTTLLPGQPPPAFSYPTAVSSARVGSSRSPAGPLLAPNPKAPGGGNSPTFSISPYGVRPQPVPANPSPPYLQQTGVEWHSSGNNSLYNSDSSPAVSAHSSVNPFEYLPVQQQQQQLRQPQQQTQSPTLPIARDAYLGDFVSPTTLQSNATGNFDFAFGWGGAGGGVGAGDIDMTDSNTMPPTSTMNMSDSFSPIVPPGGTFRTFDSLVGTPEGDFSGSEGAMFDGMPTRQSPGASAPGRSGSLPESRPKRAKKSPVSSSAMGRPSSIAVAGSSSQAPLPQVQTIHGTDPSHGGVNKSRLRSASRASKNTQHRPEETMEERKSRNSHNLVEKQYRNRLNAQFESLLNVLPDSLRASATGGGEDSEGGGGGGGGGAGVDFGEKRVSKAEVLDMARRRIKMLEKERDDAESQRDQLLVRVDHLEEAYQKALRGEIVLEEEAEDEEDEDQK